MNIQLIEYPTCSTCRKAKKFLQEQNIAFTDRMIVEQTPSKEELQSWLKMSSYPLKKLFNTSGKLYREMQIKDRIGTMSEDEILQLLSQNGMLIKRPLLVGEDFFLIGFDAEAWSEQLLKK